ncbi:MAG: hypothetical protein AVDCRST_MAG87-438, partial [uncultured Thermomicrobiales bacterium]
RRLPRRDAVVAGRPSQCPRRPSPPDPGHVRGDHGEV